MWSTQACTISTVGADHVEYSVLYLETLACCADPACGSAGLKPYTEVAFLHKASKTLLVTDALIHISPEPPEVCCRSSHDQRFAVPDSACSQDKAAGSNFASLAVVYASAAPCCQPGQAPCPSLIHTVPGLVKRTYSAALLEFGS